MWTCPKCERRFNKDNQSHYCTSKSIDELFVGKSEDLVLAFERVLVDVFEFGEISVGVSVNTIIFTNKKAFLIIRPMSKLIDIKFYSDQPIKSSRIFKEGEYGNKYYHHIRIKDESDVDHEIIDLLRIGYNYGLK